MQSGSPVPVAPIVKQQHSTLQGQIQTGWSVDEPQAQTRFHGRAVHRLPSIQTAADFTLQAERAFPATALVDRLQHGPSSRRSPEHLTNLLKRIDSDVGHESIQTKSQLILARFGQNGAQPPGPHPKFGIEDVRQAGVPEVNGAASHTPDPPKAEAAVRLPVQVGMKRVETGCQSPLSIVAVTHGAPASRKGKAGENVPVGKKVHADVGRAQSPSEIDQGAGAVEVLEIAVSPQDGPPVSPVKGVACKRQSE